MPGELVTLPWHLQLGDGPLMGTGCTWDNTEEPWELFGVPVTDRDRKRDLAIGERAGRDTDGARLFSAPLSTAAAFLTEDQAITAAFELEQLFAASGVVDLELHLMLPGLGHRFLVGRPRGAELDLTDAHHGIVGALVFFKAHLPTLHEVTP